MMNNWMTVKVKYTKQMESGSFKRVTEPYLLAAYSFTDAESRIYEELGTLIKGEFDVVSITRTELHDIFGYDDADVWYLGKIKFEFADLDTEKTKKVTQKLLVAAHSVKDATDRIKENLSGLMDDYEITGVVVTPIVEVFPFNEKLDREISRVSVEDFEETLS